MEISKAYQPKKKQKKQNLSTVNLLIKTKNLKIILKKKSKFN